MTFNQTLTIKAPSPFDFESTNTSHGWSSLLPNTYNRLAPSLSRIEALPSGKVAAIVITAGERIGHPVIVVSVEAPQKLTTSEKDDLIKSVRYMLRLDEDFSEFYGFCSARGAGWAHVREGSVHLLRSPTLFEDMVKVLCTTNTQWGGTKRMVADLVRAFGSPFEADASRKTFPHYTAIAGVPFDEFQNSVKLGYRAEYIHRLASQFAEGEVTSADFQDPNLPTAAVHQKLLSIKGFGAYAAASMLMLLGRYDHLPVDSVFRQFVTKKYFINRPYSLPEALSIYDDWGKWKYLAYWMEMLALE